MRREQKEESRDKRHLTPPELKREKNEKKMSKRETNATVYTFCTRHKIPTRYLLSKSEKKKV